MAVADSQPIREKDLQCWKLLPAFLETLETVVAAQGGVDATWKDPRRKLQLAEYLSLFLFGLFNPVVKTMRGLCAATQLERVQREVSGAAVSLGSFPGWAQRRADAQQTAEQFARYSGSKKKA